MLNMLRRDLEKIETPKHFVGLVMESATGRKVRDRFLSETELQLLGSENDPQTAKEIEAIPEFEGFELTEVEKRELEELE